MLWEDDYLRFEVLHDFSQARPVPASTDAPLPPLEPHGTLADDIEHYGSEDQ